MQLDSRIGLTSFAKSILCPAGGGRAFACSGVILAETEPEPAQKKASTEMVITRFIEPKISRVKTENEGESFRESGDLSVVSGGWVNRQSSVVAAAVKRRPWT